MRQPLTPYSRGALDYKFIHMRIMKKLIPAAAIFSLSIPLSSFAQTYKYEPAMFTLQGKLLSTPGETPDGKKITFPALRLQAPITVQGDQETRTENGVALMHLVVNPKMMQVFKSKTGKSVSVTGTCFIQTMETIRPMC